jgi:hypothetical protein
MAADYFYSAVVMGVGLGLDVGGYSGGVYGGCEWSTFEASRDWTLEGFVGDAALYAAGADAGFAGPSKGYATFAFMQMRGSKWWPKISTQTIPNIDTGSSISLPSIGASRGFQGTLFMKGEPFPYEGP